MLPEFISERGRHKEIFQLSGAIRIVHFIGQDSDVCACMSVHVCVPVSPFGNTMVQDSDPSPALPRLRWPLGQMLQAPNALTTTCPLH